MANQPVDNISGREGKLPAYMTSQQNNNYAENNENTSWMDNNLHRLMVWVSVIWFAFVLIYITQFFGWSNLFLMMPDEFGGFLAGVTLPLAVIWVVIAYIDRGSSFKHEAKLLRTYMNNLVYPSDASGAETAQAMAEAIRAQVQELHEVTRHATEQTEFIKNELGNRVDDFAKLVGALDNYSSNTLVELNENVKNLVKSFDYVADKAASSTENLRAQASEFSSVQGQLQNNISELFNNLAPRLQELRDSGILVKNIAEEAGSRMAKANELMLEFNDRAGKNMTYITDAVSAQAGADFFESTPDQKPLDIARLALDHAKRHFYDVLIVDTAGRLAIDEAMMQEVSDLADFLNPAETLFVIDAMLGQDAVNTARAFNERLSLTGVVLTKLDGDSRGGAALSVRMVTGKPIKFVGLGEKLDGFELFNPEQMAGRILGMGDIVSLVKDVQKSVDQKTVEKLAKKIKSGDKFDLEDFKGQISQMKNMGPISGIIEKLPAQFQQAAAHVNDKDAAKQIRRTEGIINSMTPKERRNPEIIKASRKRRIAAGAGVTVQEVNRLLKQFEQTRDVMKHMQKGGMAKMMRALGQLGGRFGGFGRR